MKFSFKRKDETPPVMGMDALVDATIAELASIVQTKGLYTSDYISLWEQGPTGVKVALMDKNELADFVMAMGGRLHWRKAEMAQEQNWNVQHRFGQLLEHLVRRKPAFRAGHLEQAVGFFEAHSYGYGVLTPNGIIKRLEDMDKAGDREAAVRIGQMFLDVLTARNTAYGWLDADLRKAAIRLMTLVEPSRRAELQMSEPWQKPFVDVSKGLEPVLQHAREAKSATPSARWSSQATKLLQAADQSEFLGKLEKSVAVIGSMTRSVDAVHSDFLRGLMWTAALVDSPGATPILGGAVLACGHKLSGVGARSTKGFLSAVYALETIGSMEALAELSKCRAKIKTLSLAKTLIETLERTANARGLSIAELEELTTPTFGLDQVGTAEYILGDSRAVVSVRRGTDVAVTWYSADKEVKSVPARVKSEHAEDLAEIKNVVKQATTALSAHKLRIEGMMLSGRTLPYPLWRERYVDHPLIGQLCRKLIWDFSGTAGQVLGMATDGVVRNVQNKELPVDAETQVRLWHPIGAGLAAIEVWREYLFQNEVTQPFKQAFREIYLVTDAERATETYSNRFAAHLLKQHQFSALARQRGWEYQLQGYFDSYATPVIKLRDWGMSAQFFVEVVHFGGRTDETVMSPAGIALYVTTDQVRFLEEDGQPVRIDSVPPVVFSEVMRDVDLFVGVANVGNDPGWIDQGQREAYSAYWLEASFGNLSATAETRRAVLTKLLPRLKIAPVAHLEGRFLVVKGKLRTYKIHLGSGNILMEPNDQYLCIVPERAPTGPDDRLYLPFEGDGILSIVLSKAFLLAQDHKITDPVILRQIKDRS